MFTWSGNVPMPTTFLPPVAKRTCFHTIRLERGASIAYTISSAPGAISRTMRIAACRVGRTAVGTFLTCSATVVITHTSLPTAKVLQRRDEVVRAGERAREERQTVAHAIGLPGHVLQHRDETPLFGAEPDEHRPVVGHGAVGHVAAKDLSELVLIGARRVRIGRSVIQLDAVGLRAPDHLFLFRDRL